VRKRALSLYSAGRSARLLDFFSGLTRSGFHGVPGRLSFSEAEQALMFMAGANSIFNGDKLLTTPNPEFDADTVGPTLPSPNSRGGATVP
jgi:hypothetical protein